MLKKFFLLSSLFFVSGMSAIAQVNGLMAVTVFENRLLQPVNYFTPADDVSVTVYPEITDGQIIISCPEHSIVEIFSLDGKRVLKLKTHLLSVPVNLKEEKSGSYFINISSGKDFWVRKIILKK